MGAHLIDGLFQSDKYPTTPAGKVPLSCKDPSAQDLLWRYAQRRRALDAEFSADLEEALRLQGYRPQPSFNDDGPRGIEWLRAKVEEPTFENLRPDGVRKLLAVIDQLGDRAYHAEVQLAGCGVAANDGSEDQAATPGMWGWSASYGDVLRTRRELESARNVLAAVRAWADARRLDTEQSYSPDPQTARYDTAAALLAGYQGHVDKFCMCKGLADGTSSFCTIHCCGVAAAEGG